MAQEGVTTIQPEAGRFRCLEQRMYQTSDRMKPANSFQAACGPAELAFKG